MVTYDVAIVGAGTGGSITAQTVTGQGFKVCLIDQKRRTEIGDKACGDAVGRHQFDSLKIAPPKGDELANKITGIDIFSPDLKTVFRIKGEGLHGFIINRPVFGQRLLSEAIDAGAEFHEQTTVLEPMIKDGNVVGVKARDQARNEALDIYAKVVVDASGMASVLRKKMPAEWNVESEIRNDDVEICYREIRELPAKMDEPEFCRIYLNQKASPGGYYWIFPENDNMVNVGLGVQMVKGFPNPRTQLYTHVLSRDMFKDSKMVKGAGGTVSTRRPIGCMVGNGILFVGDSACQPNPIHGGGIGPSMIAGRIAAKAICEAIKEDDVSQRRLWQYNVEYMRGYGAKAAALDVFRIFLQRCRDDDLDYGMANRLVVEDDLLHASLGEDLRLNITDKARRVFRGIKKLPFLKALNETAGMMREVKKLYRTYPEKIEDYGAWAEKVENTVSEMEKLSM